MSKAVIEYYLYQGAKLSVPELMGDRPVETGEVLMKGRE